MFRIPLATTLVCFAAQTAPADVSLRFVEGAPKDRFVLTTSGAACAATPMDVTIDLDGSAGALVFDVTEAGAGVEVFQPFELVEGADLVTSRTDVKDGDTQVQLGLTGLASSQNVTFTIDVDDTINAREITVTDSEIEGAVLRVTLNGQDKQAVFGANAVALISGVCS